VVELVSVVTSDGLRLDGALHAPVGTPKAGVPLDACLLLHGTGSNFYGSGLLARFAAGMTELGLAALRVNTRGHDAVSHAARNGGSVRQGAAFEVVDHCRYDVRAWVEFLRQQGYSRLLLLGHSLGAVKALYALGHEVLDRVGALVAVSPPRLAYSLFLSCPQAAEFRQSYEAATALVQQGRGDTTLEVRFPIPYMASAAGFLDKYGPEETYDYLKWLKQIPCPMLFLFGEKELGHVAFAGCPDRVASLLASRSECNVATVAGADHFYSERRDNAFAILQKWLQESRTA
jgi:pimeloyl-ACP methyl ester carboxylesterase